MNDLALSNERPIFQHTKRREWGLSVIAWETKHKRGYLFENGQIRVMAEPFYSLMHEVDRPRDEVEALYEALRPELEAARREVGVVVQPRRRASTLSFDDQLTVFLTQYPRGFGDPAWIDSFRGAGTGKALARHRDPAIERAAERFAPRQLEKRIADRELGAAVTDLLALFRQTDLVTPAERSGLSVPEDDAAETLLSAVLELLEPKREFGSSFDQFVLTFEQVFGRTPGWQIATALPALVQPLEHVCVRPTSFREQAKWMSPRLTIPKRPSGGNYSRCLTMAKLVFRRLGEEGQEPRDLLDVYDFMRVTTAPAARQVLARLKQASV